jgi:NAD(P)-dependent dehydrogenase (short-subunit alcohol dehydrogenase family)
MGEIRFDGRVAIVTGAGGGLGREHALLLASRGARVVVNDLGGATDGTGASAGPAEQTVKEIVDLGGEAVADTSTVATVEGGQAIVDTAVDAFGRVDIVISNAASCATRRSTT